MLGAFLIDTSFVKYYIVQVVRTFWIVLLDF
jgi:hypothetical protein